MSLWLQSLCTAVDGVNEGSDEEVCRRRAKIVLAYFSMPVPSNAVTQWLQHPDNPPVYLLDVALQMLPVLHELDELKSFDLAALLALSLEASTSDARERDSLADPVSRHPISDYVEAAVRHLAAHPELRTMAEKLIAKG